MPYFGEDQGSPGCCGAAPGTVAPSVAPYVVSLNNLFGIVTLAGTGAIEISSSGNTITVDVAAGAGLGSVTSVGASSASTAALTISGSPITTNGTLTFTVDAALVSIAGLTTAADKGIYTTASDTYATYDLTSYARTLLDDANAATARGTLGATTVGGNVFTLTNPSAITFLRVNADNTVTARTPSEVRTDLSLVIGTNVQAWSADLDSFVTHASWSGNDLTLAGGLTLGEGLTAGAASSFTGGFDVPSGDVTMAESLSVGGDANIVGNINGATWNGNTIASTYGGTGQSSYVVGDLLYANTTTTLARRAAVATGSVLISQGTGTAPVWGDVPNAALNITTGKTLWVDSVNGNNSTGTRGYFNLPYLSIQNAINAASSGDTVVVLPGTYAETVYLADGVAIVGIGQPYISQTVNSTSPITATVRNLRILQLACDTATLVRCYDCVIETSSAASPVIIDPGSTVYFYNCEINYTNSSASYYAMEVSGTVKLFGCRVTATGGVSVNCVYVASDNLQATATTFISGLSANSLYSTFSCIANALGCYANTNINANVTVSPSGGLAVDASVS